MPERIPLNRGWEFTETFSEAFLRGEGAGETVCLPHTCREVPYSYFDDAVYQMDCAYRRRLTVPESWAGKRVFLLIGAAGHRARVYLDGARLSEHKCGYTAFRTELPGLVPGKEALLTIEVDSRESVDQPPFGFVIDYLTFGGLYREVWLEITEQTFLDDVFVKTDGAEKTDTVVSLAGTSFTRQPSRMTATSPSSAVQLGPSVSRTPSKRNW